MNTLKRICGKMSRAVDTFNKSRQICLNIIHDELKSLFESIGEEEIELVEEVPVPRFDDTDIYYVNVVRIRREGDVIVFVGEDTPDRMYPRYYNTLDYDEVEPDYINEIASKLKLTLQDRGLL